METLIKKNSYKLPADCVVVDIETTGFSAYNDSIIEIAALKIKDGEIIGEFSSLIKPKKRISSFIQKLTGITPLMVENAPLIEEVLKKFLDFCSSNPIVGHNIGFDLRFINHNLSLYYNKTLNNPSYDTIPYSKKAFSNLSSYKLTSLANHLNIDSTNAHRALKDCHITFELMKKINEAIFNL